MPDADRPRLPADLLQVIEAMSGADLQLLFADLLTDAERGALAERWAIVCHLAAGESQRGVRDVVGAAVATVNRGARQLKYGAGGFTKAFDMLTELGLPDPRTPAFKAASR
jgi:Trp operon repressor